MRIVRQEKRDLGKKYNDRLNKEKGLYEKEKEKLNKEKERDAKRDLAREQREQKAKARKENKKGEKDKIEPPKVEEPHKEQHQETKPPEPLKPQPPKPAEKWYVNKTAEQVMQAYKIFMMDPKTNPNQRIKPTEDNLSRFTTRDDKGAIVKDKVVMNFENPKQAEEFRSFLQKKYDATFQSKAEVKEQQQRRLQQNPSQR